MKIVTIVIQIDGFRCAEAGKVTLKWFHSSFSYSNCRFKGYYLWLWIKMHFWSHLKLGYAAA